MAADTIGNVTFDFVRQAEHPAGLRSEARVYQRDGIDGHAAVGLGTRGPLFRWRGCTKWSDTAADAKTFQEAIEALKGTIVAIRDHYDIAYENVLVFDVGALIERRKNVINGLVDYRTVADVAMQRMY